MSALMHYADGPVILDRSRAYEQHEPMSYGKPGGFWVSVAGENDWPSWCRSEDYATDHLVVEHVVTLAPNANALRLDSAAAMSEFHQRFAVETDFERRYPVRGNRGSWPIDWRAVSAEYDGVIIAPYQWSQRLDLSWYYTWDCASGCIWNLDAIASLAPAMEVAS